MALSGTLRICHFITLLCLTSNVAAQSIDESSAFAEITSVLENDFVDAWEALDATAIAELWTEDGDWSNIVGSRNVVSGKSRIRGVWEVGLQGRETDEQLQLKVDISNIKRIEADVVLVDLVMTFAEDTPSAMREAFVMVLKKVGPSWKIVSARAARLRD